MRRTGLPKLRLPWSKVLLFLAGIIITVELLGLAQIQPPGHQFSFFCTTVGFVLFCGVLVRLIGALWCDYL
ncbi:hypothetical protein COU95_02935 [Candidatus Shapirobacteria bacterium CG10_big_fil_rev_8_21_14_0_10_40_9]|uniref:Uncharacterized protein n=1 Tax=Candidatus Shapirobacteria bacterium CG10_big_fil_rev_8_21_14_0_10_40_9 TaxID=1974888 RepID=A0A2M8L341_9BACT|nr:MAG: hypothetical protein COU95_02935 [Candidatus Shapirobacteria bacterium CG10_big_fil_rev_8_21_14_0_10_40_9]